MVNSPLLDDFFLDSIRRRYQYSLGAISAVKSRREVVVLLRGRLAVLWGAKGSSCSAGGEDLNSAWKGGISGLKVAFFFPLSREEDILKVVC